jgi:nitrite reductase/ring-hydroxylating ferredoxin subunit
MKATMQASALGVLSGGIGQARVRKLAEAGWIWEGQGLVGGVDPSIFGVGEGAEYFGLKKVCYMFHPNDKLAMEKLSNFEEVVCDIAKWKFRRCEGDATQFAGGGAPELVPAVRMYRDGKVATMCEEAETVSRLSLSYGNVTGAIDDELFGHAKREGITPDQYKAVYHALKGATPRLKLWGVLFDFELNNPDVLGYSPYMDLINVWIWNSKDFPSLDGVLERCRELFPAKPIVLGCYLRDFFLQRPMPLDMLEIQWEAILKHVANGTIAGYSILGSCLIDGQPEQARWVRDFIKAN